MADPNGLYESILNGDAMTAAAACGAQTTGGYSENANAGATLAGSAFRKLAVSGPAELVFGCAPKPVRCGFALAIGEGIVFPEVNFTLPAIAIEPGTWGEVCAHYEGIAANIIKRALALRVPGKSATCAHFSPVGNIAGAMCDLWSNESVQNIRLLSGNAPEAYTELLAYDCRLMNTAAANGQALKLRDWMTESDEWLRPQAAVLSPAATCRIAETIVGAEGGYRRTVAVRVLREGAIAGKLALTRKEQSWLDRIDRELDELPDEEDGLLREMLDQHGDRFNPADYGLA